MDIFRRSSVAFLQMFHTFNNLFRAFRFFNLLYICVLSETEACGINFSIGFIERGSLYRIFEIKNIES